MSSTKVLQPESFPVHRLLEYKDLDLEVFAGHAGLERTIPRPDVNRPAVELAGFFERWQPERVQILGTGEMAYIESRLTDDSMNINLDRIFSYRPPCVIVTRGMKIFDVMKEYAEKHSVALLRSTHVTTRLIKSLWDHLELELSPFTVVRGVLMDVFNVGVLITGASSIGKSETALELLSKGHTFVADDLVKIRCVQLSRLIGTGRNPVPFHMECRGIGIIDVSRMYGPRCIRQQKQVDLVIELEDWDAEKDYERLGIENRSVTILGTQLPLYSIPVKPGRNIGTIVEVAVLDNKLKQNGVHMAKEYDEKLIQAMKHRK